MGMVWTPIAAAAMLASTVATFCSMLHLRFRWDVHASSVRWLFWLFFLYMFAWCFLRSVYYVWMTLLPPQSLVDVNALRPDSAEGSGSLDESDEDTWTPQQVDRLGIHAILHLQEAKKPLMTTILCAGDVALCGIALTLFPLTYELARLARISMDRGVQKEQKQIKRYFWGIHLGVLLFAVTQLVLCVLCGGYNVYAHRCLLCVYIVQFLCMAFMAVLLIKLKVNGRKYETIHGTFVASPVYQRLKRIMFVYIFFSFQFQLSTLIIYVHTQIKTTGVVEGVGVSLILYNCSGLALAVTTSCSQACVFSTCAMCLPEEFEAEYLHSRFGGQSQAPADEDLEAPTQNPVFVYTDIESSSALWAIGDGEIMEEATEIHDNIVRSSLPKYRGYEITTVGDAFQLAFRSIKDAIEYCLDVQLQLLVANWPREIHGAIPATQKIRSGRRVIFNGLRVRMGIHDALDSEGTLVQDVHAVTGKTTYTGISEVIAEYVGDMGTGGQIMVTGRVASWLKHHREEISVDIFMDRVGQYTVPQVNANVEVFHVLPSMLTGRADYFAPPEKGRLLQEARNSLRRSQGNQKKPRHSQLNRQLSMPLLSPKFGGYSVLEAFRNDKTYETSRSLRDNTSRTR